MDPRVAKLSDIVVNYSVAVRPDDWVVIQTTTFGEPLARACAAAVLKAGGYPSVFLSSEEIGEDLFNAGNDKQLQYISPAALMISEKSDVHIAIIAPGNTHSLAGIDPSRMAVLARGREPLMDTMMRRTQDGSFRWNVCAYPTPAGAQDAHMSLDSYSDFIFDAALLKEPDPVHAWKNLGERQQKLIDWLSDKSEVHIVGPDTDLKVGIAGRTWINDKGEHNFPGGEVFTGPVEESIEGTIAFTYPGLNHGREVSGVRLVFKAGVVVEATATVDEAYLHQMLDMDAGARRLGEFAFGTNPGIKQFSKNTLFDEKIGGTLHMALGRSYPETGGVNESALHWDMVTDLRNGSEVTVDGKLFSRNGEFAV